MGQWILLLLTITGLILLAVRKPPWLVPLLAMAVALEISVTWYPDFGTIEKIIGEVSLTKLTSFALILAALLRLLFSWEMRRKLAAILKDPLSLSLIVFLLLGAGSVLYSEAPGQTASVFFRLLVLYAVFLSIALLAEKDMVLLPFRAVHTAALALAPLAFYEAFSGNLIWQAESLLKEHTLRVNATFIDPNIFARFLVLGIIANFILQIYARDKGTKQLYLGALAVLFAQLVLTSSRGGILTLIFILLAVLVLLPNRKAVLWVLGLGALCGAIVIFIRPDIWARMLSVTQDLAVSNAQRLYLWKAGIAIFKDHPILGTGLGSFQTVFLKDYLFLKNIPDGATLSHTTILTIAAELGLLGLTALVAFWVVLLRKIYAFYTQSHSYLSMFSNYFNAYYVGAGYLLWIAAVFISSQGEGRFFEDPVLWLSCALLVVISLRNKSA